MWGEFDDIGMLEAIASTLELMANAVLWSGLREGRRQGFGVDLCGKSMVLRDPILGPSESPVLNDRPLWDLAEVLLKRRRVEFGGSEDGHIRGEEALQASVVKVGEVVETERLLQRLWRQRIFLFYTARC